MAPVIMMSQNRHAAKDRVAAEHDYEVNLKSEMEIPALHRKIDTLREQQWVELVAMQQQQIQLLWMSGARGARAMAGDDARGAVIQRRAYHHAVRPRPITKYRIGPRSGSSRTTITHNSLMPGSPRPV